jgi:hypothetical protein
VRVINTHDSMSDEELKAEIAASTGSPQPNRALTTN